jgi:hypothetical protein
MWAMTGRGTMVGRARWAGNGGSYRTVQRCFYTVISWPVLLWVCCRHHVLDPTDTYVLAGDACVVTKSGKKTYGVDRCCASLYGNPVPGRSFFALSWMSRNARRSSPLQVVHMRRTEAEKAAARTKAQQHIAHLKNKAQKGQPGRPKGSKNREKTHVVLSPVRQRIQTMIQQQLAVLNGVLPVEHPVVAGYFGNHPALHMVRGFG